MSADLYCPYCDEGLEVNHDDGFGYSEDVLHEMQCDFCEKSFVFQTSISFYYSPQKADCLNGADHKLKPTCIFPVRFTKMACADCEFERNPTPEEMAEILERNKS